MLLSMAVSILLSAGYALALYVAGSGGDEVIMAELAVANVH